MAIEETGLEYLPPPARRRRADLEPAQERVWNLLVGEDVAPEAFVERIGGCSRPKVVQALRGHPALAHKSAWFVDAAVDAIVMRLRINSGDV